MPSGVDVFLTGTGIWDFEALHPGVRLTSVTVRIGDGGQPGSSSDPGDGGKGGDAADKTFSSPSLTYSYSVGAAGSPSSAAGFDTTSGYDNFYAGSAGQAHGSTSGGTGGQGGNNGGAGGSGGSKKDDGNPGQQSLDGRGGGGGGGPGKNGDNPGLGGAGSVAFNWTGIGTTFLLGGFFNGGNYANS